MPILNKKNLDTLPPHIFRFRLRLARFEYAATHIPGKFLYTADALSRAPHTTSDPIDIKEAYKTESFICSIQSSLPAQSLMLEIYKCSQQLDTVCAQLISYYKSGWLDRKELDSRVLRFWPERSNLSLANDLVLEKTCNPFCLEERYLGGNSLWL